eukprot:4168136-Amphidinium_carterae.1
MSTMLSSFAALKRCMIISTGGFSHQIARALTFWNFCISFSTQCAVYVTSTGCSSMAQRALPEEMSGKGIA